MKLFLFTALTIGLLAAADSKDDAKRDLASLQGAWTLVSAVRDGKQLPADEARRTKIAFKDDTFEFPDASGIGTSQKGTIRIDPSKSPKWMDSTATNDGDKGALSLGIYEIKGDDYKVCFAPPGKERPKTFGSKPGSAYIFQVWKREPEKLQATLTSLEKKGWEALKKQDAEAVKNLTVEDFVWIFGDGIPVRKNDLLKDLANFHVTEYSMEGVELHVLNKDAAFLLYRVSYEMVVKGEKTKRATMQASSGYVLRDGHWLNAFYQETPVLNK